MLGSGMLAVCIPLACEAALSAKFVGTDNKSGLAASAAFVYIYLTVYDILLDAPGYFYVSKTSHDSDFQV